MHHKVAAQDQYQQDAYTLAGQGIGAYQPYLTQAAAYTGPGSQAAFMSPYQQDVIDTTMAEYDTQAQKGLSGIGLLAAKSGNLGGGREGVMRSEYSNKSDLNRALLSRTTTTRFWSSSKSSSTRIHEPDANGYNVTTITIS